MTAPASLTLLLSLQLRGKVPNKMLKKAMFKDQHFDSDGNFINKTVDPVTKKVLESRVPPLFSSPLQQTAKVMHFNNPTRDLGALLLPPSHRLPEAEAKEVMKLKDLLEKIFTFDLTKRITVKEALVHPFLATPAAVAPPVPKK